MTRSKRLFFVILFALMPLVAALGPAVDDAAARCSSVSVTAPYGLSDGDVGWTVYLSGCYNDGTYVETCLYENGNRRDCRWFLGYDRTIFVRSYCVSTGTSLYQYFNASAYDYGSGRSAYSSTNKLGRDC